jgi:hypothetical protein
MIVPDFTDGFQETLLGLDDAQSFGSRTIDEGKLMSRLI